MQDPYEGYEEVAVPQHNPLKEMGTEDSLNSILATGLSTLPEKTAYAQTGDHHIKATFQALVDAIIPATPELSPKQGPEYAATGMDLNIDEYVIWCLDHGLAVQGVINMINVPLSSPTAELLDVAASRLVDTGGAKDPQNILAFPDGGTFATLSRNDRCRAITLLERNDIDLGALPSPYQNNAGLVKYIAGAINRFAVFGYYSEWSGYGTTRLASPESRMLESVPLGWQQVQYPGPSNGYRELRGYKVKQFTK